MIRSPFSIVVRNALLAALGLTHAACGGKTDVDSTGGPVGSGGGAGAAAGGAGGGASLFPCDAPTPVLGPDGAPTGYVQCADGVTHRPSAVACGTPLPRPGTCDGDPAYSTCSTDADCRDQPNGYCTSGGGYDYPESGSCYCNYGCVTDADCDAGFICVCGDPVGYCAQATCSTNADCGEGLLCASYVSNPGCGGTAFACQQAADACGSSLDCPEGQECTVDYDATVRTCQSPSCAIGRPFLVSGAELFAPVTSRSDWADRSKADIGDLSHAERRALAAFWTDIGLMEHASVAAFARFALQLLSLGAPADLVAATATAMADETEHARLAFGLASGYAGAPVGPAELAVPPNALDCDDLRALVRGVILEGCIGETIASVEAGEALAVARDPAVHATLARVAPDEARHAALAWRFVQWMIECGGERTTVVREELAAVLREENVRPAPEVAMQAHSSRLEAHGRLDPRTGPVLRRRVLEDVVFPLAQALLNRDGVMSTTLRAA